MLKAVFNNYSARSRKKRADMLGAYIEIDPSWRVLDLGGGSGDHIHSVLPDHRNIWIADLLLEELSQARSKYGYSTLQIDGSKRLPFADNEFDFVFCSSVIEHVTGPKEQAIELTDSSAFRMLAQQHQKDFANEIRRISKRYYVQTPHRYFIIESHSWLPGVIVFLNRPTQVALLAAIEKSELWPKSTKPDWNLLVPGEMKTYFPDAHIVVEKSLGFPKSIMAIKT